MEELIKELVSAAQTRPTSFKALLRQRLAALGDGEKRAVTARLAGIAAEGGGEAARRLRAALAALGAAGIKTVLPSRRKAAMATFIAVLAEGGDSAAASAAAEAAAKAAGADDGDVKAAKAALAKALELAGAAGLLRDPAAAKAAATLESVAAK